MSTITDPAFGTHPRRAMVRFLNRRGFDIDETIGLRVLEPIDDPHTYTIASVLMDVQAECELQEAGYVSRALAAVEALERALGAVPEAPVESLSRLVDNWLAHPASVAQLPRMGATEESLSTFAAALRQLPAMRAGLQGGQPFLRALLPLFMRTGFTEQRRTSETAVRLAAEGVPVRMIADALGMLDNIEDQLGVPANEPAKLREQRREDLIRRTVENLQKRIEDTRAALEQCPPEIDSAK